MAKFVKWEEAIRDLVALLGVNTPQNTRREQVAAAIGLKVWQIDSFIKQLRKLGALETTATAGGFHEIRGKQYPVRAQTWVIKMNADQILAEGKKRNIKWGKPERPKTAAVLPSDDGYLADDMRARANRAPDTEDSPFAVLRPLKRDEAAALIEAARQYSTRRAFIDEEIARFAEHGLTLDPAAVGLPVDERLEAITPIVDYVSRLQRENERLQAYANEKSYDKTGYEELQRRVERQDRQLEQLSQSRAQEHQETQKLLNQWSGKEATYKQKIAVLEQENRDLRNAIARSNGTPAVADATQGMRRGI